MNLPPGPSSMKVIHTSSGTYFHHVSWTPPPSHAWKLNFAGFIADNKLAIGGAAFVIRDENAVFKTGFAFPLKHVTSLAAAELAALTTGLQVAVSEGIEYVEIEGDFGAVFHLLGGRLGDAPPLTEGLVKDCRDLFRGFRSVAFHCVEVISNQAANRLAMLAVRESGPLRWCDAPPKAIAEILFDDVIGRWYPASDV